MEPGHEILQERLSQLSRSAVPNPRPWTSTGTRPELGLVCTAGYGWARSPTCVPTAAPHRWHHYPSPAPLLPWTARSAMASDPCRCTNPTAHARDPGCALLLRIQHLMIWGGAETVTSPSPPCLWQSCLSQTGLVSKRLGTADPADGWKEVPRK